jgi:hypothetical protein
MPDATASSCITVGDLQKVIVDLLVERGEPRSSELDAKVYADLVTIIGKQTGMKPPEIHPDSRWIGDITRWG